MSFAKFLYVIEKGLFLPKASLFEDKWEALLPYCNSSGIPISSDSFVELNRHLDWIYVSCWTKEPLESYAMWKIYGKENFSVAIVTTTDKLGSAYLNEYSGTEAHLGEVKYRRPGKGDNSTVVKCITSSSKKECIQGKNSMPFLYHKHKTYEFENEIRLVALHAEPILDSANQQKGLILPVASIPDFAEKIIISPMTSNLFLEAVQNATNKTSWKVTVEASSLNVPNLP